MRCSDAMGAVAELAASQHGAFSRRQAAAIGLTRRQIQILVRDRFLDEPIRGVLRVLGAPATWKQSMMVATLAGSGFCAAFRAAAHLHWIDGFEKPPKVEVAGGPSCRSIKGLDVIQHWVEPLDAADLVVIDGIPCLGLARTVVDVASLGDRDLALRAVDDFERRGFSLNWLRLTTERLHRPGQSGTNIIREILDRRQTGGRVPDSWFERLVERCFAMPGLPPWVRQHEVFDDAGNRLGRLDLACPELLLGVEAHSKRFHFGERAERMDQRRENRLGTMGWHVTYVGWYDKEDPAVVAATIEAIARRRIELFSLGAKSRRVGPM